MVMVFVEIILQTRFIIYPSIKTFLKGRLKRLPRQRKEHLIFDQSIYLALIQFWTMVVLNEGKRFPMILPGFTFTLTVGKASTDPTLYGRSAGWAFGHAPISMALVAACTNNLMPAWEENH